MKKFFTIIIFFIFSSTVFAENNTLNWKWGTAFNSVVLVSGENEVGRIVKDPFDQAVPDGPMKDPNKAPDSVKPKVIPYGMGSGFFINEKYIITNYHVIKGFEKLSVYVYNHPYVITDVELVGYDESIDIAVLQVNEKDIPNEFLEFAEESPLIGDDVYAIGHGMSQVWSLTKGILSYDYRRNPGTSFVHYLQTDAVINSGNSGGPLLNEDSEVIGVNTLIMSGDKFYVGYGYVIPAPLVERVATQIIETGKHVKPSIGIKMSITEDRELYEKLKSKGIGHYLEIQEVIIGSAAEQYGIQKGDIIMSIDDTDIQVLPQVIEFLWTKNPGDEIVFKVYRNNETVHIPVILGTLKEKKPVPIYGK
jgi:serine protease Do